MLSKLPSLIVFFWFQLSILFAQTPSYYHYTTADGLASSTVFNMMQDSEGLLWFATLNGASKFDGSQFTTYRTVDGLNSNSIISIIEGENGTIYFGNYNKGINVLQNGKIKNFYQEMLGQQFPINTLIYTSSNKNHPAIYAFTKPWTLKVIREDSASFLSIGKIFLNTQELIKLVKLPSGEIYALTTLGISTIQHDSVRKLDVKGLPETEVFSVTGGRDSCYFAGLNGKICQIKNNQVIREIEIEGSGNKEVISLIQDSNEMLWFTIMGRGLFCVPKNSVTVTDIGSKIGLQQAVITHILEDDEGNIWLSTYGNGAYCLNHLYLRSFSEADGMSSNVVNSITKSKIGQLLIGTINGINILENGIFSRVPSKTSPGLIEYIYHIKNIDDELYICGGYGKIETNTVTFKNLKLQMSNRQAFCKTGNGLYLFGDTGNSLIIRNNFNPLKNDLNRLYIFGDSQNNNRVNEIVKDSENSIWIGTNLGLCKAIPPKNITDSVWIKTFYPENPVMNSRINSILEDQHKKVWFAGEKGIASYDLKNSSISSFTEISGHDLSASTSLASDEQGRIWIGNMKGLYIYDGVTVKYLNVNTGLPSNEILSLFFDKEENLLYIGTTNGLSVINLFSFDKQVNEPPEVIITGIKAGDSVFTDHNNLVFSPWQNDVYLKFAALNYSSPGSVNYKYSFNNEWRSTVQRSLNFISLNPGVYTMQIMARTQSTDWGKPIVVRFQVLPGIIETIWFKLLMAGLLLMVVLLIILFRHQQLKKKNSKEMELITRINALKHQALSAMMNPHFISNSLNSVQYLVNSRRYEAANEYIAMMAKLMRKNLDTAGSGFILLSEEINRLKLYLELEKMRFQDGFTYEMIVGNSVTPEVVLIPNMIIQPFVENSLWHGVLNSGRAGLIIISFNFEDVEVKGMISKCLLIKITDNGVGFVAARKFKKDDHISKGILIIEERLNLLSSKLNLPKPIIFEDLSGGSSNSEGAEVIISLPSPLYKLITK